MSVDIAIVLSSLELKVELPGWLESELELRGLVDARHSDLRRTPRFRCCGQAVISPQNSHLGDLFRQEQAIAIVRDLSRTGMGLLTHQQWFPDQIIDVLTSTSLISARVVRTRYLGPRCFSSGVQITKVSEVKHESE